MITSLHSVLVSRHDGKAGKQICWIQPNLPVIIAVNDYTCIIVHISMLTCKLRNQSSIVSLFMRMCHSFKFDIETFLLKNLFRGTVKRMHSNNLTSVNSTKTWNYKHSAKLGSWVTTRELQELNPSMGSNNVKQATGTENGNYKIQVGDDPWLWYQ
jgi:hypothetical protein